MVWHKSVNDAVSERLNYSGASDFVNGKTQSVEYLYDDNGNLVKDENKGLNFSYDLLGHPLKVWSDDGKNIIEYVYAADGRKLQTRHSKKSGSATVRDFRGALEVVNGYIDRINFQGGFYSYDWVDDYYSRNYYIQDYQDNIRMTVSSDDWSGIVSEYTTSVTDYYPYGNPHRGGSDYKYSGKYLDRTYGLDLYDFEARRFDAIVPVFDSQDQLAEKYYWISPYVYCAGDPVNLVDPDGRDVVDSDDARKLKSCMIVTEVGREVWNAMEVAKYPISIVFSKGSYLSVHPDGKSSDLNPMAVTTVTTKDITNDKGEKETIITNVSIEFFDATIDDVYSTVQGTDMEFNNESDPRSRYTHNITNRESLSKDNVYGATGVHEGIHATDEKSNKVGEPNKSKREENPIKQETKFINQLNL